MAVRISATAAALKRSANSPTQTAYTIAGWFYFNSVTPARFWGPLGIYAGADGVPTGGISYQQISSAASGSAALVLGYDGVTSVALKTVVANTWYFIALRCSALAAGGLKAYIRAAHEKAFTVATNAGTAGTFTAARFEYGRDAFAADFMDGAAQHCVAFDRGLDEAELMKLSLSLLAEKPFPDRRNLNVYYRLRGADDIQDLSGNQRAATFTPGANAQGLRVWPSAFKKRIAKSGGARTVNMGLATSANTALAMTHKKTKAIGLATSTNTSLAMTRRKSRAMGLATASSSALAMTHTKRKTLGLASSANTALAMRPRRLKVIGLALSTNVALAMSRLKRKVLGLPSSTNTAFSMTPTGPAPPTGGNGIAGWIDYLRRRIFYD